MAISPVMDRATHASAVERLLACPTCRAPLRVEDSRIACRAAPEHLDGTLTDDDVVFLGDRSQVSFFDDRHEVMEAGKACEGAWCLCYEHQATAIEPFLRANTTILDVGCGPSLPYRKPDGCFAIGLEASYESIRVNRALDMRVYGTAAALPLPDRSVDTVLCFYSIHHMTGRDVRENWATVGTVFDEFARVLKPGGDLLVCEVSPWRAAWVAQNLLWDAAKKALGPRLDMFFYTERAYRQLGERALPAASFSKQAYGASMLSTFPPAFSVPWLRVPRFLYPFHVNLYRWSV